GLKPGAEAFALVKSSSVILMAEEDGTRVSARNRLTGTISRIQPGAVNSEVVLDLPGGATLAAIVTRESSDTLDLAVGRKVTAIFKASSVIVGVPA
ncbi:MAG TPA: molybdenum-dependent transcriptional regulator, partial [Pseudomonas sp.]|nr:molybdenum-dependent transcriptional regulator [Pseudomonas sp.]